MYSGLIISLLCLGACAPGYAKGASIDVGAEAQLNLSGSTGIYPSAGVSFPVAGTYISVGAWGGTDYTAWYWGQYLSWGYSWLPFETTKEEEN